MEAVLDGKSINNLADFYSEVERKLTKNLEWSIGRNLNAFTDVLRGGFGLHGYGEPLHIKWINYRHAEQALGWDETIKCLTASLKTCHPSNLDSAQKNLDKAKKHIGETLFETVKTIIVESKNVELILVSNEAT
jgi:RNAse (barnase) inhibitor barstar